MSDLTGLTTYSYDAASRRTAAAAPFAPRAQTYLYDAADNRTVLIDPDNGRTTYSYDPRNLLIGLSNPYNELTTISYDPLGRELTKVVANGQMASHAYDPAGRETVVLNTLLGTGATLTAHTATYDPVRNRIAVAETVNSEGGFTTIYGYDAANQVASEVRTGVSAYSLTYTYDPVGNQNSNTRSAFAVLTNQFSPVNQIILSTPTGGGTFPLTTFLYDAAGNRTLMNAGGALTTYAWDYENRMTLCLPSIGVPLTNLYDATGLRRSDGTNNYIWDEQNLLQTRAVSNGAKTTQFVGAPATWGGAVSQRNLSTNGSEFYAFDQGGNLRAAAQAAGSIVANADYLAFGKEHLLTGNGTLAHYFGGNWGYFLPINPAYHYYIRQRWYDSLYGQWLSKDRIGRAGGENLYQFVENNAVTWADPSGLHACNCPKAGPAPTTPNVGGYPCEIDCPPDLDQCNKRREKHKLKPIECKPPEVAVFISCFNDAIGTSDNHLGPGACAVHCKGMGLPLVPGGSTVIVPGIGGCQICDCGRGPGDGPGPHGRPKPDSWMDVWYSACSINTPRCWLCVTLE